jgi:hypothetical protein
MAAPQIKGESCGSCKFGKALPAQEFAMLLQAHRRGSGPNPQNVRLCYGAPPQCIVVAVPQAMVPINSEKPEQGFHIQSTTMNQYNRPYVQASDDACPLWKLRLSL